MVSDVYVGGDTSLRVNSKMYTKLDSCLVIPPTPNRAKPRAIVKFLGGAFIGVVPEVGATLTSGLPQANLSPAQLEDLPLFSIGHRLVLGPAVSQMMLVVVATPFYSIARNASGDVRKMMLDAVRSTLQEIDQEILNSLTKFVDQLPSVMNEVTTYSLLVEAMVEAVSKAVVVHVKLNLYEFRGFLRNAVEELEQKMRFDDSRLAHQGR
ncbi:hypothetical protein JHK82_016512 [Glycine max]|nr:hypothetical protein JHK82_016512 [Glycine max]